MTSPLTPAEIETLRQSIDCCDERALAILDRLSPAPEPEVDEATRVWREMPAYRTDAQISYLREVLAAKDAEREKAVQLAVEDADHAYSQVSDWRSRAGLWQERAEKAESELAALRAENERLKADKKSLADALKLETDAKYRWKDAAEGLAYTVEEKRKAAERNPAEPEHHLSGAADSTALGNSCAPLAARSSDGSGAYGKVHTDGSRSGGMPPGTNAGAVEVTEADREATARALDTGSNSTTWEKLTASHRTPDQLWQAKRAAQAIARHRTEAEARGRREALEKLGDLADERWARTREGAALRGLLIELKRMTEPKP